MHPHTYFSLFAMEFRCLTLAENNEAAQLHVGSDCIVFCFWCGPCVFCWVALAVFSCVFALSNVVNYNTGVPCLHMKRCTQFCCSV